MQRTNAHYAGPLGAFHAWSNETWAGCGSFFAPTVTGKCSLALIGGRFQPWLLALVGVLHFRSVITRYQILGLFQSLTHGGAEGLFCRGSLEQQGRDSWYQEWEQEARAWGGEAGRQEALAEALSHPEEILILSWAFNTLVLAFVTFIQWILFRKSVLRALPSLSFY